MRKTVVFLSLMLSMFFVSESFAQSASIHKKFYVYKHGGGPGGFKDIKEGLDGDVYSLLCNEAGTKKGEMTIGANDKINTDKGLLSISKDIEPYVIAQLANDVKAGVYVFPGTGVEVTWKGNNADNYKMRIVKN
jgi:hypothetical protein